MDLVYDVLDFAQTTQKPIMIAESAPFGGIQIEDWTNPKAPVYIQETYYAENNNNNNEEEDMIIMDEILWEDLWFEPVLDLIEKYDIGMWSYIHCDWNAQPMWKGTGFGDTRISASALFMERWYEKVLTNPRFFTHLQCAMDEGKDATVSSSSQTTTATTFGTGVIRVDGPQVLPASTVSDDVLQFNFLLIGFLTLFVMVSVVAMNGSWGFRYPKKNYLHRSDNDTECGDDNNKQERKNVCRAEYGSLQTR